MSSKSKVHSEISFHVVDKYTIIYLFLFFATTTQTFTSFLFEICIQAYIGMYTVWISSHFLRYL